MNFSLIYFEVSQPKKLTRHHDEAHDWWVWQGVLRDGGS